MSNHGNTSSTEASSSSNSSNTSNTTTNTQNGKPSHAVLSQPSDIKSPSIFLQVSDSSEMFRYVNGQAWKGAAIGTGISAASQLLAYRFAPWYRKYTNISARAFLLFSGAGIGFTLASEWAMEHHHRQDYLSRLPAEQRERALSEVKGTARSYQWETAKNFAWDNRFRLIFAAWATTISTVMYRDFKNPLLNTVHKVGHARLWSQAVTIAAVILAFAFNEDSGPNAAKYKDASARDIPKDMQ